MLHATPADIPPLGARPSDSGSAPARTPRYGPARSGLVLDPVRHGQTERDRPMAAEPADRVRPHGGHRPLVEEGPPASSNHLLRLLADESPAEYEALAGRLEAIASVQGAVLHEPGEPLTAAYFPLTAVCSTVRVMDDGRRVEVGTTGFEGMVGLPLFLEAESTPFQTFVQLPGTGWRLPAPAFREAAAPGRALHAILQRFAQYLYDQAAQLVACNRLHSVDQRCARWLLMTHDRVGGAETFPLTHEYLAIMLGVRRASVSTAAEALQEAGRIRYRRGRISVTDRSGLEDASCECYQADRADYQRLLGGAGA